MSDLFQPEDLDTEVVTDFMEGLKEELEEIEHDLLLLERQPNDKDVINSLFRAVHTIKGNARMCFFEPICEYVHDIEEVLSEVRAERLHFTSLLGEAVLLSLDQLKIKTEELGRSGQMDLQLFNSIRPFFRKVRESSPNESERYAVEIINTICGGGVGELPLGSQVQSDAQAAETQTSIDEETYAYFQELAKVIDAKCPFWEKRTSQQCQIALAINRHLQMPVDNTQLTAAVMLHDIGMVFLPESLINKAQKFNNLDEKQVRQHVRWSTEWLKRIPHWEEAALMVEQHHERPDGKGYPKQLVAENIVDGAQIIAIVDTFYSITNQRSDRTYKKSLMRAITEINSYAGMQFKEYIVEAFNEAIRELYTNSKSN